MTRLVVLFAGNGTKVVSDTAGVPVLVIDRNIREAETTLMVDGEPAVARALLGGIPQFSPERVEAIFADVAAHLSPATTPVPQSKPRVVVLIERGAAPEVLVEAPTLLSVVINRDVPEGQEAVQAEGAPAAVEAVRHGLQQVAPRYVASVFDEVRDQLDKVFALPTLPDKKRMQLLNVARAWFGVELL
jgi:hypothetical protein